MLPQEEQKNLNYVCFGVLHIDEPLTMMMTQMGPKISRGVNISSAFVTRFRGKLPAAECDRVKIQNSKEQNFESNKEERCRKWEL